MSIRTLSTDVVVAGAGLAGITAALEAARSGVDVVVLSLAPVGFGSNSALSNGVFAGPTSTYTIEAYIADTLKAGGFLNDEGYLRRVASKALTAVEWLRSLGVNIVEESDHYRVSPDRKTQPPGSYLMSVLRKRLTAYPRIRVFERTLVKKVLLDGETSGSVCGVVAFNRSGDVLNISASSVILATGGGAALYKRSDNHKAIVGYGYALAAALGLVLYDMELVQFYPIALAEPGLPALMLAPPHPPGTMLRNSKGVDLIEKYGLEQLNKAVRFQRDRLSLIIVEETSKNGGVYIDYTGVPSSFWEIPPLCRLARIRHDFRRTPARILPVAHFFMGGVKVDEQGMTAIPGLFACGELVWGLHGANRRGGNALTECVLSGMWAGRGAARWAVSSGTSKISSEKMCRASICRNGGIPATEDKLTRIKREIRNIAWDYAGICRSEDLLLRGKNKLLELFDYISRVEVNDSENFFLLEDLKASVITLSAVIEGSLIRRENIGSFRRADIENPPLSRSEFHSRLVYEPSNESLFSRSGR
ncbi:FAD-binding protein [Thermodesulforhabdus norvegica]|uniref:Fumarate reductase (CoM/CoB) subunit A n=1 Tax=Thermodesulforhabdus norvegica TaxID=39841 RepID=A0A1I4QT08_9BACT|nr:FAD-binding protein [Thermodesulforhabdus norvegica]SFM43169.1 fumarate reductase (CoM/CoB) subunit A [Thermodesulforhabdus norvegica]